jgi:hypothetical protein
LRGFIIFGLQNLLYDSMDPISALSVAAAAVQFVSFSCSTIQVISRAISSKNETKPQEAISNLNDTAAQLKETNVRLKESLSQDRLRRTLTETEVDIAAISDECITVADRVLNTVSGFGGDRGESTALNKLKDIRDAITAVRKKETFDALKQKLDDARNRLMLVVFLDLR